ncbi:hypothetical protein B0H14DRAFT_2898788 [Mycena olivaceomarginata]|nr:hypothetical protein B0H14DRAFT_2898788 [Mycena olivaceomarginata]
MFLFSTRTLSFNFIGTVVLGFCAPSVLPFTITGPSPAHSNGPITITWTSVSTDNIDIDKNLDSLLQSDPYYIINDLGAASGSATFDLPALSVRTHRIAFSSTDGFQILTEGSIEILAEGSSLIPSSSSIRSSTNTPIPTPPAPPNSPSSPTSSTKSSPPSISTSTQSQTTTSEPQRSPLVSSPPVSSSSSMPSPSSSLSPSIPGSTQSQPQPYNAGAITGGVAGATVVILLALLGCWHLSRRRRSAAASQELYGRSQTLQFLAAPVSNALDSTPPASTISTSRKRPISAPAVNTTQSGSGPLRDELLEEVQRLRQHMTITAPPAYPGHE